jgi:integrase
MLQKTQRQRGSTRWTATSIAKLPPGRWPDPGQPGLYVRVREKRGGMSRTWLLRFELAGSDTDLTLGHFPLLTLDGARQQARHFLNLKKDGIDPRRARPARSTTPRASAPAEAGPYSVEFLISEFIERHVRPRQKHPEHVERILHKDVLTKWRGRDARTIEPHEVIALLDGVVDRGSRVMANRLAGHLEQLFKFGIHRQIVKASPVQLLYRPGGTERPRKRVLSDAELQAYFADPLACTRYPRLSHVINVLLLSGQRRGELAQARWSHIDFDAKTWMIPDENAKTGRGHVVPLSDWAVAELKALKREAEHSPWVLPGSNSGHIDPKQLTRSLAKCLDRFKKRGIANFVLHDLRRTCRTGMGRLRIEPHIAERVLNHTQGRIAETYDTFRYDEQKRVALEQWAAHLEGLKS